MYKEHWENIYSEKAMTEVSWYQAVPETSLELIKRVAKNKDASIIDVGGGDGYLVDELIQLGYNNITVLDISVNAINKAKKRLGGIAKNIKWIISDITEFNPTDKYDVWHDRAVFHFLTKDSDIEKYKSLVNINVKKNGHFILATFADNGPDKCSGLCVSKYSEKDQAVKFKDYFTPLDSFKYKHPTPFGTTQNFTFSVFKKEDN
jgi:2-polyprenyl-3-methyl-5-hydroxy-6-metoxy-1,4-benzoquinol methylase